MLSESSPILRPVKISGNTYFNSNSNNNHCHHHHHEHQSLTLSLQPGDIKFHTYFDSRHDGNDDDKFLRYDSSPEGSASCDEDEEDQYFPSYEAQAANEYDSTTMTQLFHPVSSRLDPFSSLPIPTSPFEDHLIWFYATSLTVHNPIQNRVPRLGPRELLSLLSVTTPGCIHAFVAHAAHFRLSSTEHSQGADKRRLSMVLLSHKKATISNVRKQLSNNNNNNNNWLPQVDGLLSSMIILSKMDSPDANGTVCTDYFAPMRDLVRSINGPLNIPSTQHSRILCYFEITCGTAQHSCVWNRADFLNELIEVNHFFSKIWSTWRMFARKSSALAEIQKKIIGTSFEKALHTFGLKAGSALKKSLSYSTAQANGNSSEARNELLSQLAALLTLCGIIADEHEQPQNLQQYVDHLHDRASSYPSLQHSKKSLMWLLLDDNHSKMHSNRIWAMASHIWILKHVNCSVLCIIKEWLLKFLNGLALERLFKLDAFYFSYAS